MAYTIRKKEEPIDTYLSNLRKYISRSVLTKAVQMEPTNLLRQEMMQSIESSTCSLRLSTVIENRAPVEERLHL